MASLVRRRRPCATRRSMWTRISADVPRSASRTAAAMASRSASVKARRGPPGGGGRRTTADAREHGVHRGVETGGVALLPEARGDDVADDRGGDGVGDHGLETVADLDPQLPLLQEDDEEDAVAEALAADLPPLF